jgi:hypothetical protein
MLHVGDETWMMGFGSQYTHGAASYREETPARSLARTLTRCAAACVTGGYVDMTDPTCRGSSEPCPVMSGIQKLALSLHLNIFAAIGRGVFVEMRFADHHELISRSAVIQGGSVDHIVEWTAANANRTLKREFVNAGCAYQGKDGVCTPPNAHRACNTTKDCECFVQPGGSAVQCEDPPGTCKGVHNACFEGICQAPNVTGGEACGVYKEVETGPPSHSIGTDLKMLTMKQGEMLVMSISMWAADLYSLQFVCGGSK